MLVGETGNIIWTTTQRELAHVLVLSRIAHDNLVLKRDATAAGPIERDVIFANFRRASIPQ